VANGCFTHLISALAHDEEVIDELFWLGFGMVAVDAIRDLGDAEGPFADVEVRRAGVNDLEAVVSLIHEYGRYMAESPTFEALVDKSDAEFQKATLSEPSSVTWLSLHEGEAVACMRIGPSQEDASYVILDEKTASITMAFTKEHLRGRGIGATKDAPLISSRRTCWAAPSG
jgi:hypothetical protein